MKFLLTITHDNLIKKASLFDGFILPIKQLSKGFDSCFAIEELNTNLQLIKEYGKEAYLLLNDLYKDQDFLLISDFIKQISLNLVNGFIVSDIGLLEYFKSIKLNKKVVYYPSCLITSVNELNSLKRDRIKGVGIANNIGLNDILDISKKAKLETFLFGFGRMELFTSITKLVTNYKHEFNLPDFKLDQLELVEKMRTSEYLPIVESGRGTTIFSSQNINYLASVNMLKQVHLNYFIFDSRFNNIEEIIRLRRMIKDA